MYHRSRSFHRWIGVVCAVFLALIAGTAILGLVLLDTERQAATERLLSDSRERLRAIADALPDLVLLINEDGRFLEILSSSAVRNLLYAEVSDLLGKSMLDVLPKDDAEKFLGVVRRTLETGQALARFWNEKPDAAARRRLAASTLSFTLAGHAAFVLVVALAAEPLANALLGDAGLAGALRAGACTVAANGVFAMLQGQFRWELRPRAYAAVSTLYAAASLLAVGAALLLWGGGLEGVLWAYAAAAVVACAIEMAAAIAEARSSGVFIGEISWIGARDGPEITSDRDAF